MTGVAREATRIASGGHKAVQPEARARDCGSSPGMHVRQTRVLAQAAAPPLVPLYVTHLGLPVQPRVQLLQCGLDLAHALATSHQQHSWHVLQQTLRQQRRPPPRSSQPVGTFATRRGGATEPQSFPPPPTQTHTLMHA